MKNKKTRLVQQQDDYGCAVACLAMATGNTYQQARLQTAHYWDAYKPLAQYNGLDNEDEKAILFRMGYRVHAFRPLPDMPVKKLKNLAAGMPALLTVPSINVPGLYHGLYWDGRKVYDPSKLKTYNQRNFWGAVKEFRFICKRTEAANLFGIDDRYAVKFVKLPKSKKGKKNDRR